MTKIPFEKLPLTYDDQLSLLESRGLIAENRPKALFLLENISYYRLSAYWYPLQVDRQNHQFRQGSRFTTAFQYYCFDKELRKLVSNELEKIEISVRAKMIYILSHEYGPFWYEKSELFRNPGGHAFSIAKIEQEFNRSDEQFIKSFKKKYLDPLPPSWMIFEIISFGSLSTMYSKLRPGRTVKEIASHYGLPSPVFESWLHCQVYLRNVCAHHSRLWNRDWSPALQFHSSEVSGFG